MASRSKGLSPSAPPKAPALDEAVAVPDDERSEPLTRARTEAEIIATLLQELDRSTLARTEWRKLQERFYKKRFGIRPEKTFPWPNAANFNLPLIDKSIRKAKPYFVGSVANVTPAAAFHLPGPFKLAEGIVEEEFHYLFMERMKSFASVVLAADWVCEKGFLVAKVFYDTVTERVETLIAPEDVPDPLFDAAQTAPDLLVAWLQETYGLDPDDAELTSQLQTKAISLLEGETISCWHDVVTYDAPRLVMVKPEDIITPPETKLLEDAGVLFHVYRLTARDLKARARDGRYRREVVQKVLDAGPDNTGSSLAADQVEVGASTSEAAVRTRTGQDQEASDADLYTIVEAHHWEEQEDGTAIRKVRVIARTYPEAALAVQTNKRRRWPFVKLFFDLVDTDWLSSRGFAAMLDHLQSSITLQHNQMLDRQTLSTALSYKYVPTGMNPARLRFQPGQGVPVRSMQDFEWMTPPQMDASYDKNQMANKAWAEEYIGNQDFGMTGPLSLTRGEARSATEIQAIQNDKQLIQSLDIRIWLSGWQEVFALVWEEWVEHGPRQEVAQARGSVAVPMPPRQAGVTITPNGTLWNLNPLVELQKAEARLLRFAGDPRIDQRMLYEDYLRRDDPRLAQKLLLPEQVVQQKMQEAAMQAAMAGGKGANGAKPMGGPKESLLQRSNAGGHPSLGTA